MKLYRKVSTKPGLVQSLIGRDSASYERGIKAGAVPANKAILIVAMMRGFAERHLYPQPSMV